MKFEFVLKGLKVSEKNLRSGKEFNLELEELSLNGSLDEVKEVIEFLGKSLNSNDGGSDVAGIESKADFHEAAWKIYSEGGSFEFNGDTYEFTASSKPEYVNLLVNGVPSGMIIKSGHNKDVFTKFFACEMAFRWNEYNALKD